MRLVELRGDAIELLDVLDTAIGLDAVLRTKRLDKARAVDDGLHHVTQLTGHVAACLDGCAELPQRASYLGGEQARLGHAQLRRRKERKPVFRRIGTDLAHRRGADATARRVDHTHGAHVVVRVDHQLEVGHNVANLRAVKEACATHDLVRHTRTQEHVFEDARLRVGAVEDRDVVVARAGVVQLLYLRADPTALVALVRRLEHADLLAVARGGEQVLLLAARVVRHYGVGRRQDMARRAVVLLKTHHLGLGVVLLKVEDVLDVSAAPAVDGLVVVAHHHEVAVLGCQEVGDGVLGLVGVLILVHADLTEAFLIAVQHLGMLGEQLVRTGEQVIEVHRIGAREAALELCIDARGLLVGGAVGLQGHLLGRDEGVLCVADDGADGVERVLLWVDVEVSHDVAHQAAGVVVIVDGEVGAVAQKLRILAQDAHAHGMKRANPHATRAGHQLGKALAHLCRGLVGEGDGQDLPGAHALVANHVGNTIRQHARLARACPRKHQ